jgi:hypothetical protein
MTTFQERFAGKITRVGRDGTIPDRSARDRARAGSPQMMRLPPESADGPKQSWRKPSITDLFRVMEGGGRLEELAGGQPGQGGLRATSTPPRLPAQRVDQPSPPMSKPRGGLPPAKVTPSGGYAALASRPPAFVAAPAPPPPPPRKPETEMTADELLAFSRKPRDVEFKPKTGSLPKDYQLLGGLGPDLQNEALVEKVCRVSCCTPAVPHAGCSCFFLLVCLRRKNVYRRCRSLRRRYVSSI